MGAPSLSEDAVYDHNRALLNSADGQIQIASSSRSVDQLPACVLMHRGKNSLSALRFAVSKGVMSSYVETISGLRHVEGPYLTLRSAVTDVHAPGR